jgi:hypothetical protein
MSSAPLPNPAAPSSTASAPSGLAAVITKLLKGPLSALHVLLLSLVAVAAALLLCILLSINVLPGYPDSAEKNVPIYSQAGPNWPPLILYVNPPLNSIQASGENQFLAVQFTNRGTTSLNVTGLDLSPGSCFDIVPADRSPTIPSSSSPVPIEKGGSAFFWYRLSASKKGGCLGQFPLVLRYSWKDSAAAPKDPDQRQSISTGPIQISTYWRIHAQRFFSLLARIIPLILLPVVLAAGGYVFQLLQDQKARDQKKQDNLREKAEKKREARQAERQKLQEQQLEVWKTILPGIIGAIREHYIPIVSLLTNLKDETASTNSQPDTETILACALIARRKVMYLTEKNGGLYFESLAGETLCSQLINIFRDKCYEIAKDRHAFQKAAEFYPPDITIEKMRTELRSAILSNPNDTLSLMFETFRKGCLNTKAREQLDYLVELILAVLEFESNAPLYVNWYHAPQTFDPKLKELVEKLDLPAHGANTKDKVKKTFAEYLVDLEKRYPQSNAQAARVSP